MIVLVISDIAERVSISCVRIIVDIDHVSNRHVTYYTLERETRRVLSRRYLY